MAVYNSSVGSSFQDDSDITIINPSIINEDNDEDVNNTYVPIITRLKQADNSTENRQASIRQNSNSNNKNDYIFVDHDPLENAKKLEQLLNYYIRDLKQETNTQLDCDKQLITRIMDLIRPAYINNQEKNIELDHIMADIGLLHDKRHIEQKEKVEKLRTEICHLKKMLFTANNDQVIYNDNPNPTSSMFSTMNQRQSIHDYEQWTEIEDDAKKLHELVESQKNQINEIVNLISQTASASASLDQTNTTTNKTEETIVDKQTTPTPTPSPNPSNNIINTLLQKIKDITRTQSETDTNSTLINRSPGASPTESLNTLTTEILTIKTDDSSEQTERPQPVPEQSNPAIDIPLPSPPPTVETKKCPVCNYEFALTSNDVEMYDHIEKCLFPTGAHTEPKDYECPNCNKKYQGIEEGQYLQHLSDCYNRDI